jgi:hypothetical protein
VTQYVTGGSIAGCGSLDIKCICSNSDFLDGIACCLAGVCSAADQEKAVTFAKQICTTNGVSVPDKVVCKSASTSAGSTSTSAPASSSTSATVAPLTTTSSQAGAPTAGPAARLLGAAIAAVALL